MQIQYKNVIIANLSKSNADYLRLYSIFRGTVSPGISFKDFHAYYFQKDLDYISVCFCFRGNEIIGFCSAAFYKTTINNKKVCIGRSATGFITTAQGNAMPKWILFSKFLDYKLKHLPTRLIFTAFIVNPIMYAMVCKYTALVWPRINIKTPEDIVQIQKSIAGINTSETLVPYIHVSFEVYINKTIRERVESSKSKHIKHYLCLNPAYTENNGLIVIIPFTVLNIIASSMLFAYYGCIKNLSFVLEKIKIKWLPALNFINERFSKANKGIA
jgi:hypothetical protein